MLREQLSAQEAANKVELEHREDADRAREDADSRSAAAEREAKVEQCPHFSPLRQHFLLPGNVGSRRLVAAMHLSLSSSLVHSLSI